MSHRIDHGKYLTECNQKSMLVNI